MLSNWDELKEGSGGTTLPLTLINGPVAPGVEGQSPAIDPGCQRLDQNSPYSLTPSSGHDKTMSRI